MNNNKIFRPLLKRISCARQSVNAPRTRPCALSRLPYGQDHHPCHPSPLHRSCTLFHTPISFCCFIVRIPITVSPDSVPDQPLVSGSVPSQRGLVGYFIMYPVVNAKTICRTFPNHSSFMFHRKFIIHSFIRVVINSEGFILLWSSSSPTRISMTYVKLICRTRGGGWMV